MKILLAVDGSANAVRATHSLVGMLGWYKVAPAVELLTVHLPVPRVGAFAGLVIGKETIERYYREEGEMALAPSRQVLDATGISYSAQVAVGEIGPSIVGHAQQAGCAMICMGTRGMSAIAGALVGSIAVKVLHQAHVPVLLVP
jgi:nucleotide-binding universal stress UspA family protein